MKLLVDLGNTRVKAALWDGARLDVLGAVAHARDAGVPFASLWTNIQNPESAWVASVAAGELDAALAADVRARFGAETHFVRSSAQACGVRSAYAQPERLGVDRFLALIAAHALIDGAAVIAGCGTALTLDAIKASGEHLGGLIAPSPDLMRAVLYGSTARLGPEAEGKVVAMADNTVDAVTSGTWLAAAAMVERFVASAAETIGSTPQLVLTGGGADRLAALVRQPHRVDAELVLRGLALYANAGG